MSAGPEPSRGPAVRPRGPAADDIALVTCAAGRHDHLRRQRAWIAALDPPPRAHVVVAMGDPAIAGLLAAHPVPIRTEIVELAPAGRLPLSAARNAGVARAASLGATSVALLDVDCLPDARLVGDYAAGLAGLADGGPHVVCGRVRYLPAGLGEADHTPATAGRVGRDHPARVVPGGDAPVAGDPRLLWSLNLALTVRDWDRIGGFDERYTGYGGEDTDFGQRLAAAGGTMWWSGRAGVFHQHHPVSSPPVEHAADIARNATLFRSLWGFDPMEGWLADLEAMSVLRRTADGWAAVGD